MTSRQISLHIRSPIRASPARRSPNGSPGGSASGSPLAAVWSPNNVALNAVLAHGVAAADENVTPGNTLKQQDPKVEEYFQFCDLVYPNDRYKYILNQEKIYRFMWYQSF
jgi:hypothetical protein